MTEWTKDKEKKVLWKYRFLLTFRVIRVVLILLVLYAIYMITLSIGYDFTKFDEKRSYHINLAIDWTQAGLQGDYHLGANAELTPFFTEKVNVPVTRTIGKEEKVAGEWKGTKRLLNIFSSHEMTFYQPSDNKRFGFYLPKDPRTGEDLYFKDRPEVWEPLEKVHEGTVADLAFSTRKFYKPEELLKKLEKYDVDVQWMPLYAGEIEEYEVPWSQSGSYLSVNTLGMTRAIEMADDYMSSTTYLLDSKFVKENEKTMLVNMEKLLENESKSYLENFLGLWNLEERYEYLKENEFLVYGAVVTGPVKELLKLKEEPEFRAVQIGDFEYWNWTEE